VGASGSRCRRLDEVRSAARRGAAWALILGVAVAVGLGAWLLARNAPRPGDGDVGARAAPEAPKAPSLAAIEAPARAETIPRAGGEPASRDGERTSRDAPPQEQRIAGRVLDGGGRPVAGVALRVLTGGPFDDFVDAPSLEGKSDRILEPTHGTYAQATSDDDGHFEVRADAETAVDVR
jgi:hypothetical protein